ncbi:MAG: NADP-dependent phosphogluconate dehydrogenase, partial [Pseudomonadales bacterium]|nr:NADP-dependent phosphogluconate dehydrogenase [Pseudomonadales bacterium]
MEIGMVGLGRMGSNMAKRLMAGGGHRCVVYDPVTDAVRALGSRGAIAAESLADLVRHLAQPRAIWLMLPASIVDRELDSLLPLLDEGDVVIDGGNSFYRDDIRRAAQLKSHGLHYVDVGTSGGVAGFERGYCLMIGGEAEVVDRLTPIFAALAPGVDGAARTPGRSADVSASEQGFLHCGPAGAGHFVKMVHNGIEYGLMAA